MKKVAIIDKVLGRARYSDYFPFEFDNFHMSDVPITKLLKKDVTLKFDHTPYDLVILVGSEAAKEYAKISSVTNMSGHLVDGKFVCITNPAALIFKPEGKPDFQRAVDKILKIHSGEITSAKLTGDFAGIRDTDEAIAFLKEVLANASEIVTWDTETTALYPRDGYVLGVSITYKKDHGRYILTDCLSDECVQIMQEIANKFEAVFHNMKFDIKMLKYHLGLTFPRVHDTMLLHYVLDENSPHGLKPLALKHTTYGNYDEELDTFKKEYCSKHNILQDYFTYDLIPYEVISTYASIDTAVTYELYNKFMPLVRANPKLLWVYENLMVKGSNFLMNMEEIGIPMSVERLKAADAYLTDAIHEAKEVVFSFDAVKKFEADTGKIFNPNSVMQLRSILFDYLGLQPTGKKTATGAVSTDVDVLTELAELHPLPGAILNVRKLGKLQNTYTSKILAGLNRDERIRTNFNLTFTTSGRLSSSGKFNAQQITRDDPIIKGCIQAPKGYVIVSQDLVTGEVYYAAVLSGDKNLQAVFKSGGDLHSTIAKSVFGLACSVEEVKSLYPKLRQAAKAITFGILYGSGPAKVAESVTKATGEYYSIEDAKENIRDYFTKFSRLKQWLTERKEFIEANGYDYSFFGRKRRLPNVFSSDKGIAAHEVRSGINSLIQSVCSDVNLLGAMETQEMCDKFKLDAKIFMLVHDSIVAIVKDEDVDRYCQIIKVCTQEDRGCSIDGVPIGVDQEVGSDYSFGKFEKVYEIRGNKLARI